MDLMDGGFDDVAEFANTLQPFRVSGFDVMIFTQGSKLD
jgi:hypothetical protein